MRLSALDDDVDAGLGVIASFGDVIPASEPIRLCDSETEEEEDDDAVEAIRDIEVVLDLGIPLRAMLVSPAAAEEIPGVGLWRLAFGGDMSEVVLVRTAAKPV